MTEYHWLETKGLKEDYPRGTVISGALLGKRSLHVWMPCSLCGNGRWVRITCLKRASYTGRCGKCNGEHGTHSHNWRHGIKWFGIKGNRYLGLLIDDSNKFYNMAYKNGVATGYIPIHRYVMAQHLGRCLNTSEVVHHRDGDVTNNAIENLELTDQAEHTRGHNNRRREEFYGR